MKHMVPAAGQACRVQAGRAARIKRGALLGLLLTTFLVCGCTVMPPDLEAQSAFAPVEEQTPGADQAAGQETAVPTPVEQSTEAPSPQPTVAASAAPTVPVASAAPAAQATAEPVSILETKRVEIYYNATPSMMGFADTLTVSRYERALDILEASMAACFPSAEKRRYRADVDWRKEDALLGLEQVVSLASSPSFYLIRDMLYQPDRVWRRGDTTWRKGPRMSEPIPGYYQEGKVPEDVKPLSHPTAWAVDKGDPDAFMVVVTDLSELQTQSSALIQAIARKGFEVGKAVGLVAVKSEFSGFVPVYGADEVWYEWGAQPSGSMDRILDYTDFQIGLTLAPQERAMASRPFYILCIGSSGQVGGFMEDLNRRLAVFSGQGETLEANALSFDIDFTPPGYRLSSYVTVPSGGSQGINIMEHSGGALNGILQLQKTQNDAQRYSHFTVGYSPKANDPRRGSFGKEDFTFTLQAYEKQPDGGLLPVSLWDQGLAIDWQAVNASGGTVSLDVRVLFPAGGRLPEGAVYRLEITALLHPPVLGGIPDWVGGYNQEVAQLERLTSGTGASAFDGSRTLGFYNLVAALTTLQAGTLKEAPLGTFAVEVQVAY